MREVLKTRHIGFCFGVNRAVSKVLKEAEARKETIYTLGPLLHNPQMVEMMRQKGVEPIDDVFTLKKGVVAYRSHGIRKEEEEYIRAAGLDTSGCHTRVGRRHRRIEGVQHHLRKHEHKKDRGAGAGRKG
jgi:4-hydroxy-3-methylbut-2-enyl diphosphate reductase